MSGKIQKDYQSDIRRDFMKYLCICFVVLFISAPVILAENIMLQWDKVENVDGYRLFQSIRVKKSDGSWENIYDYASPITTETYPEGNIPQDVDSIIVDLPGVDEENTRYMFVARSYLGENESVNSNEVEYQVNLITPPAPTDLAGDYIKKDSLINLIWTQPAEQWYETDYWKVFYKIDDSEWIEIGRIDKGNELTLTQEFDVVPAGSQKNVDFTVLAYRQSGKFSANSTVLTLDIDRREVPPIQNLRINVQIPVK